MRTTKELAWVGGLLEGEASFMIRGNCPKISLQMTDLDTVQRVASILGVPVGKYSRQPKGKSTYLPVWHLAVHGTRAIGWMLTLYQFLGQRRQAKIREVLDRWKACKSLPRLQKEHRLPSICHPDQPRSAGLLCARCRHAQWMRQYRKTGAYYLRLKAEKAATA